MSVEVRRSGDRFVTEGDGKRTFHSFSYGVHYDAANVGFGPIRAINVERLGPATGYEAHRHSDVEIVTWVLDGALRHADTAGGGGVIRPGNAQRLSAGDSAEHSEVNDSDSESLTFVQVMLASDREGAPEYVSATVPDERGLLSTVPVHAPAELLVARLEPGDLVSVPAAAKALLHVTRGAITFRDTRLAVGDEARLRDEGSYDLGAAESGSEVLVWQLET